MLPVLCWRALLAGRQIDRPFWFLYPDCEAPILATQTKRVQLKLIWSNFRNRYTNSCDFFFLQKIPKHVFCNQRNASACECMCLCVYDRELLCFWVTCVCVLTSGCFSGSRQGTRLTSSSCKGNVRSNSSVRRRSQLCRFSGYAFQMDPRSSCCRRPSCIQKSTFQRTLSEF